MVISAFPHNIFVLFQSQLRAATAMEDYEGAEELKLAIIAALRNDSVGGAFSDLSVSNLSYSSLRIPFG